MIRIVRIPLLIILISVVACTPAMDVTQAPVQTSPAVETATGLNPSLDLAPLDSPQVQADLDQLLQLQRSRSLADVDLIRRWHSHPVQAWNEQARFWVGYYGMDPVVASRVYALTSVAEQRALDLLASIDHEYSNRTPGLLKDQVSPINILADPFESAVLIGATEPVFLYMFNETPKEIDATVEQARRSLLLSGNILPGDLQSAEAFGRAVAEELINERMNDGASEASEFDPLPVGEGVWRLDPFRVKPEQPNWGKVTPWLMDSPEHFRVPPPPAFGSVAFQTAVAEVRTQVTDNTQEQMAVAAKWADKRFTYTPPGHWNEIAIGLIRKYGLSDRDAVHVLAVLNMAQMDAGIACWEGKYYYLVVRPWQADPQIASLVGYPNHPSYPSGHGAFSAAAAVTLSYFFPEEQVELMQMAQEASISRFYGGIHYRFDLEAGNNLGRQIGLLGVEYSKAQIWYLFTP